MIDAERDFRRRCREVVRHLTVLKFLEEHAAFLAPSGHTASPRKMRIDTGTRHAMKASTILHFYNLIESTVVSCLRAISSEITSQGLGYRDLSSNWQREFLRHAGKAAQPLEAETRLSNLLTVCSTVASGAAVEVTPRLAPGNLDDREIEKLCVRFGLSLNVLPRWRVRVKKHVHDDKGLLQFIRMRRNELAHGLISFADCGKDLTVPQLRDWAVTLIMYLRALLRATERCLSASAFKALSSA